MNREICPESRQFPGEAASQPSGSPAFPQTAALVHAFHSPILRGSPVQ